MFGHFISICPFLFLPNLIPIVPSIFRMTYERGIQCKPYVHMCKLSCKLRHRMGGLGRFPDIRIVDTIVAFILLHFKVNLAQLYTFQGRI